MSNTVRKEERLIIPARPKGAAVKARPCLGDHQKQVENARKQGFARYKDAYLELAKV